MDLYANLPASDEELSLDDEFGPFWAADEIGAVFRSAVRHIDFAARARTEGAHELGWARVAFASRMVGRIHLIDSVESRVERHNQMTVELKAKAIELLSCMRPPTGWKKDIDAYEAIADALGAYRDELKVSKGKTTDLVELMPKWKQSDPLFEAAVVGNGAGRLVDEVNRSKKPA